MQSDISNTPEKLKDITELPPVVGSRFQEVSEACERATGVLVEYISNTPTNEGPVSRKQLGSTVDYRPSTISSGKLSADPGHTLATPIDESPPLDHQTEGFVEYTPENKGLNSENDFSLEAARSAVDAIYGETTSV